MKIYKDILHADEETNRSNKNSYKSITRGINCFSLLLDFEFRIKIICQFYCRSLLFISRESTSITCLIISNKRVRCFPGYLEYTYRGDFFSSFY
jgi:hypothetical protein